MTWQAIAGGALLLLGIDILGGLIVELLLRLVKLRD